MKKLDNVFRIVRQMESSILSCNIVSVMKVGWGMTVLASSAILTVENMEGQCELKCAGFNCQIQNVEMLKIIYANP